MIVFRIIGFANGQPCPIAGQYLKSFCFEAENGRGNAEFTWHPIEALTFDDSAQAFKFYTTIPHNKPWREDGMPNRPMTSCHWELFDIHAKPDQPIRRW